MAIKDEAFLDLEASLTAELLPQWGSINRRVSGAVSKAVMDGELNRVDDILATINPKLLYAGKVKKLDFLFKSALVFGASRVTGDTASLRIMENDETLSIVKDIRKQYELQMAEIMHTVRRRIKAGAIKAKERLDWEADRAVELSKSSVAVMKINPINVPEVISTSSKAAGRNLISIASSLQMSRMAQYGFLSEARARGMTQYTVAEVLDSRTCAVCRRMHGKTFNVAPALAKVDTHIRITDAADLKLLAPFPDQSAEGLEEIDRLNKDQLTQRGFNTPPYHPMCRGLLHPAKAEPSLQSVRTTSLVEGFTPSRPINPKVADVLDSPAAQQLSDARRSQIIAASVGVVDFATLPDAVQEIINELDAV